MRTYINCLFLVVVLSGCSNNKAKTESNEKNASSQIVAPKEEGARIIEEQTMADTLKGSLRSMAMGTIGTTGITINYYSPAVRGRVIWGGLVPFDNVWVIGAHRATSIDFNQEVVIGGVTIAPGKYALFTIPGKDEWTIIINKNWDQHLADKYDQKDDIVRVKVKPEVDDKHQERLRYVVETESDTKGEIVIFWEKIELSIPVSSVK